MSARVKAWLASGHSPEHYVLSRLQLALPLFLGGFFFLSFPPESMVWCVTLCVLGGWNTLSTVSASPQVDLILSISSPLPAM